MIMEIKELNTFDYIHFNSWRVFCVKPPHSCIAGRWLPWGGCWGRLLSDSKKLRLSIWHEVRVCMTKCFHIATSYNFNYIEQVCITANVRGAKQWSDHFWLGNHCRYDRLTNDWKNINPITKCVFSYINYHL